MALQKQQVTVNFAKGVDTKTDPFQVPLGNFLDLQNSIFDKFGLLKKRNGFEQIGQLTYPSTGVFNITTFKGQLTALGNNLYSYNDTTQSFVSKGQYQQANLTNLSLVKNNLNQIQVDAAISPSGYICVVYTENNAGTLSFKYAVLDKETGQTVTNPTVLPSAGGTVSGSPRVFVLSSYFVIVYTSTSGGVTRLQYLAVSTTSLTISGPTSLSTNYSVTGSTGNVSFDGTVFGDTLYLFWNRGTTAGILGLYITASLSASSPTVIDVSHAGTRIAATNNGIHIFLAYYSSVTTNGYVIGVDQNLNNVFAPQQFVAADANLVDLTIAPSTISNGATVYWEDSSFYGFAPYTTTRTDVVNKRDCDLSGTLGAASVLARGVGLGSKAIKTGSNNYLVLSYESDYQSGYYLVDESANILSKVAYQNGGGYLTAGLPQLTYYGSSISFPYLYKFQIQAVNKGTALPSGSATNGVYAQTGINYASFELFFGGVNTSTNVEIGNNLNLDGGFLWSFDGQQNTENGFFVYPEYIAAIWSTTGGNIVAQPDGATNDKAYWYQVTYEWQDNQGNIFRSAPSIPVSVTTSGAGNTGSITLNIPTLRLSYKTNVKIVIYRWSIAQQNYYQVTSITSPTLNNPNANSIVYVDTSPDTDVPPLIKGILGNSLLYTTGGVLENISAPSMASVTLFDNRLWGVNGENRNELWYSKQVIQSTPVEMSDLLTVYVSPTQGAQGDTGPITALYPMDDKLIIFKKNAIYYINGTGPDNTGANSQYSEPIFITGTIGSENQNSIVITPQGLMFQSDKGIWLLGRDLSTFYIGAPVESYTTGAFVLSALAIPGTNQVRFGLGNITLMYDYFFQQWGTFTGVYYTSSCLYNGLQTTHNYLTGYLTQETPGTYKDQGNPVLMSFKTSWFALAGVLGFQRAYFLFILGKFLSPHKLNIGLSYDFNPAITQQVIITPVNYNPNYGDDPYFGTTTPWGGNENVEKWRIMLQKQKCDSVQITLSELFDPSVGEEPGAGLTLSAMNFIIGVKRVFNTFPASLTAG